MPTYPSTLPVDPRESRRSPRDGRIEDTIGDGTTRVRKLHADRSDFEIKHPFLTSAELSTLTAFYNSYGTTSVIDLVWPEDGVTYYVRFGSNAVRTQWATPTRRHAFVRLVAAA